MNIVIISIKENDNYVAWQPPLPANLLRMRICQADDHVCVESTHVDHTMPQGQYKRLCIKVKTIHFNYAYK